MPATFIGVRHHSPACARFTRETIEELQPAYVLVEGPADMNDRLDELLLDHRLPIAIFSSYRDDNRTHMSWSPFCEYSPEWVALTIGKRVGAELRFIDLPAWHRALADRTNRYADAEQRYSDAIDRLCEAFAVDNVDTLWDHVFEIQPANDIAKRLDTYFELIRGDTATTDEDTERESYMAAWIRAAMADANDKPVVVVTGGFHRPALIRLTSAPPASTPRWPQIPQLGHDAVGGSYLVPFSYKRLDAFDGYQSGMPSPHYYQRLWEAGPGDAADSLVTSVVRRLRARKQPTSTADLVAARALATGLAQLRGHPVPARTDVLDGLLAALVTTPLDIPPPWTGRGRIRTGTDPVVVEMVAALSGDRVGRLHPNTPIPPLVHDVDAQLAHHEISETGITRCDLTTNAGLGASRTLHRLRVLAIPGIERDAGPSLSGPPILDETWTLTPTDLRLPALIEASAYGATLESAASAALEEHFSRAGIDPPALALVLFDSALCGLATLADRALAEAARLVGSANDLTALGFLLEVTLGLWRHDRIFGASTSPNLAGVIDAGVQRALWLVEGVHGRTPADHGRLATVAAIRDATRHAGMALTLQRDAILGVFHRRAVDQDAPADLRGASFGFTWALGEPHGDLGRAVRGAAHPDTLGDWLAGLFAVAREDITMAGTDAGTGVIGVVDELLTGMLEHDFLVALPALRQAFSYFPPREREAVAQQLLDRRGLRGSTRALLRTSADPALLAWAREVEVRVDDILHREALIGDTDP
ncbi:MAG: DUF5682 family protein [Actinomycetota bacterium]|nr:DUF5682 family protein [Actinomycetota bacterium]